MLHIRPQFDGSNPCIFISKTLHIERRFVEYKLSQLILVRLVRRKVF
jgi:hypothetical protein